MIHGVEPSRIVIPAGVRSTILMIDPIDDEAVEGFEKVQIQLVYPNSQFRRTWIYVGDSSVVINPDHSIRAPTNRGEVVYEMEEPPDYVLQRRRYPSRATIQIVDDDWGHWRSLR